MSSHYNRAVNKISRITKVAMMKKSLSFLTISEDGCLKKWSIDFPSEIETLFLDIGEDGEEIDDNTTKTDVPPRLLHYSIDTTPSENYAAVGALDGSIRIIDLVRFVQIKYISMEKTCITMLKFSETGNLLMVGTADGHVHMRNTFDFEIVERSRKKILQNPIVECDWTYGDKLLQVEDSHRVKRMFWCKNGNLIEMVSEAEISDSEVKWGSQNCYSSWNLCGLLKQKTNFTGPKITLVRKSSYEDDNSIHIGEVIACGREDGTVEIYKFPCLTVNVKPFIFKAHHGEIADMAWSHCNHYLVTIGEQDNSIIVWSINRIF